MMYLCWKVLLPISLVCLVGSAMWDLAIGAFAQSKEYFLFFIPEPVTPE